jgi:hypothetical protein
MSNNIDKNKVQISHDGLVTLATVIKQLADVDRTPDMSLLANGSISGDKIAGGKIQRFESVGIKDLSTRLVVHINDDGILTDVIDVDVLEGNTTVNGNLTVDGELRVQKLHVEEVTSDVRQERADSLEFVGDQNYNKGLQWTGNGTTKQFILRANPDRFWSSNSIDLGPDQSFMINGQKVVNEDSLGSNIKYSKLRSVGSLENLVVNGNGNFGQFLFWNSDASRLGIGTDAPNAQLSVMGWDQEFVVDVDDRHTTLGNYTAHALSIVTDDTARIHIESNGKVHIGSKDGTNGKLSVHGKLGVSVNNVPDDVDLAVAGPVRMHGKKQEVGARMPTEGTYQRGDIVWHDEPTATGYVGWICVKEGTPGTWKAFGQIAS